MSFRKPNQCAGPVFGTEQLAATKGKAIAGRQEDGLQAGRNGLKAPPGGYFVELLDATPLGSGSDTGRILAVISRGVCGTVHSAAVCGTAHSTY